MPPAQGLKGKSTSCIKRPHPQSAAMSQPHKQGTHFLPPGLLWGPGCTPVSHWGAHPDRPQGAPGLAHKEGGEGLAPLPTLDRVVWEEKSFSHLAQLLGFRLAREGQAIRSLRDLSLVPMRRGTRG